MCPSSPSFLACLGSAALLALAPGAGASAQITISGQLDVLARNEDDARGLNRNFRSDSPWNEIRLKLFAQHWVNERIGIFTELLFDMGADARVNGAYVVINALGGRDWLNTRIGMTPSPLGNFGLRSTYFNANPLIGVPRLWQHRSTLDGSGLTRNEDLMRRRQRNTIGLPILYDACWNPTWELLGALGIFEYSVSATPASASNMASLDADGFQVQSRVGIEPVPGLRLGLSGAYGPYIGGPNRDAQTTATSFPGGPEDYDQKVGGVDFEYSLGKVRVLAEGFWSSWEVPLISEDLEAWAAYGEARYDFLPEWHAAVRVDRMGFSEISSTNDGQGPATGWDDDVLQIETALAYRIAREMMIRVGWQHTRFLTGEEEAVNLAAVQLRAVF